MCVSVCVCVCGSVGVSGCMLLYLYIPGVLGLYVRKIAKIGKKSSDTKEVKENNTGMRAVHVSLMVLHLYGFSVFSQFSKQMDFSNTSSFYCKSLVSFS